MPETGGPAFCLSAVLRFLNRIVRQDGIPLLPCPDPGRLLCALMIPLCLRQPWQEPLPGGMSVIRCRLITVWDMVRSDYWRRSDNPR